MQAIEYSSLCCKKIRLVIYFIYGSCCSCCCLVMSDSLQSHGLQHAGFSVLHHLPELAQTLFHWVRDAIHPFILCHPFLLLPLVFPSIRVFSIESDLHIRWSKYWLFSFSISPSNEYSRFISFRTDLLDLLAIQGTLKSLLQCHSSKASILQCSAFFISQLSHPYMTTGKTIALTRWTFVSKVMSLLFNMMSRLIIAFLPRSKCVNFMAAVTISSDFGAQENKVCHCLPCFPIYLPWSDGTRYHDLCFLSVEF